MRLSTSTLRLLFPTPSCSLSSHLPWSGLSHDDTQHKVMFQLLDTSGNVHKYFVSSLFSMTIRTCKALSCKPPFCVPRPYHSPTNLVKHSQMASPTTHAFKPPECAYHEVPIPAPLHPPAPSIFATCSYLKMAIGILWKTTVGTPLIMLWRVSKRHSVIEARAHLWICYITRKMKD